MLEKKIQEFKGKLPKDQFSLLMNIFNEDVIFHAGMRNNDEKELCTILGQAYKVVERVM